ncbi:alanyl-tRNA synthetase [Salpingoeca rosetta]|uniref:Alanine--tRNA ligase n=1 Tax=Salpingoeca rosetta (strain ATCC 50818 / BSB-021) TaxID=946362 RepID=F2UQ47_SALR5|nr:alanyl-tRNA synthetase [Salpingoeca rosetta]EGD79715.1 alanyl-tRNA synthetase [Salpingoeca rosetta]|eukprot:XP_004988665.1 alanyl-tRNA synthetase [Salpingoeca rosetta]
MSETTTTWTADKVRGKFISYFEERGHKFWPSSSTIPFNDPTLLFANAGMNQYKAKFLGTDSKDTDLGKLTRAVNSQKCIRAGGKHNDLDDVGKDVYHHTFFEMLGNWSFGDYWKEEAIDFSWDLLTNVFQLDPNRLYITYFEGDSVVPADEETRSLWMKHVPPERILPFDRKDNFWEMGETGPCGPCTEIHYDRIGGRDASHLVNMDDPDVLEIWNLVFMQYNNEGNGVLKTLPAQHVDTGMGLERILSVLQNKTSNYDTDLFLPIFAAIKEKCGCREYTGKVNEADTDMVDTAYRVVADHIRTLCIAIADGGRPDKDGRGYILRLVLRRAIRFCEEYLGAPEYFFASLVPVVVDVLGDAFPELRKDPEETIAVLKEEERQFRRTLSRGRRYFKRAVAAVGEDGVIDGDTAWRLWDTYGFPIHLTIVMAEERGLKVDMDGFEAAKARAVEISRAGGAAGETNLDLDVNTLDELKKKGVPGTDDAAKYAYTRDENGSYSFSDAEGTVLALLTEEGGLVDRVSVSEDDEELPVGVVLDKTNFYAEQGGQIYDTGRFESTTGAPLELDVFNVQKRGAYCLHVATLAQGELKVGDKLTLKFDHDRRRPCMSNHTATHVLNYALRSVLGEADQKGSLVEPERLRFDFTAKKGMTPEQLKQTEEVVNKIVNANYTVYDKDTPLAQARAINGLRAMFGETYPDPVRVLSVGASIDDMVADPAASYAVDYSVEFCGGTHVKNSGDIGPFTILSEEAVAKGIRRIVAVTGQEALKAHRAADAYERRIRDDLDAKEVTSLDAELGTATIPAVRKEEMRARLKAMSKKHAEARLAERKAKAAHAKTRANELIEEKPEGFVVETLDVGANAKAIGEALKLLKKKLPDVAFMFFGAEEGAVAYTCQVPKAMVDEKGIKASEWIKRVNEVLGGRGGGRDLVAQGTADDSTKLTLAQEAARAYIEERLSA